MLSWLTSHFVRMYLCLNSFTPIVCCLYSLFLPESLLREISTEMFPSFLTGIFVMISTSLLYITIYYLVSFLLYALIEITKKKMELKKWRPRVTGEVKSIPLFQCTGKCMPSPNKTDILMGAGRVQNSDVNRWKQILSHKTDFDLSRS